MPDALWRSAGTGRHELAAQIRVALFGYSSPIREFKPGQRVPDIADTVR
jgi:hypothetical protein